MHFSVVTTSHSKCLACFIYILSTYNTTFLFFDIIKSYSLHYFFLVRGCCSEVGDAHSLSVSKSTFDTSSVREKIEKENNMRCERRQCISFQVPIDNMSIFIVSQMEKNISMLKVESVQHETPPPLLIKMEMVTQKIIIK